MVRVADSLPPTRPVVHEIGLVFQIEYLSQPFDYAITVCDNAAESCPLFPGKAERIHWSFPDPAAVTEDEAAQLASFRKVRD